MGRIRERKNVKKEKRGEGRKRKGNERKREIFKAFQLRFLSPGLHYLNTN